MEWSNASGPDQHRDLELEPNAGPVPLSGHQPAQLLVQSSLGLLKGQHSPNFGLSEDQCITVVWRTANLQPMSVTNSEGMPTASFSSSLRQAFLQIFILNFEIVCEALYHHVIINFQLWHRLTN